MSASFTLLDWTISESANSFLLKDHARSMYNNNACQNLRTELLPKYLNKIIDKYYDKLAERYLCVFGFNLKMPPLNA